MKENKLRSKIVEILRPLSAFPIENVTHDGTPDVCCVAGFIELKRAERPVRTATRVDVEMRPSQRVWHRRWARSGGRSWTLTRLDTTWFLCDGLWSAKHLGHVAEPALTEAARRVWHEEYPDDLVSVLCGAIK